MLRLPRFHALDFNAKYRVKRLQLYFWLHNKPMWLKHPNNIQFDTQNICNFKCLYCNPQGTFIKEHGQLPLESINKVLKYARKHHWFINRISPFMNGEPLLEPRLREIMAAVKKETGARIGIYTNGSVTKNRGLLLDKNLDMINFTVSAATPETYMKIHNSDYFDEVIENIEWLTKNKRLNQRIRIVYVLCKENIDELELWKLMFRNYDQMIRPIHDAEDVKPQSKQAEGNTTFTLYHEKASQRIYPKNFQYELDSPCPAWNCLGIGVKGEIMHCMDLPYEFNYGNIADVDLNEAWQKRNHVGLDHGGCRECKMKNPQWRSIFEKYKLMD